jgi:dihydropteroate synthase
MASFLADSELPFVLMHMKGTPTARAADADYEDVVSEVMAFFTETLQRIDAVGLDRSRCILDPGLGFDKDTARNLQLLQGIKELQNCDQPLLIGASRKRFIGEVLAEAEPCARDWGTAAVTAHLHRHGVELVRVHNVRASVDTIRVLDAIAQEPGSEVIH